MRVFPRVSWEGVGFLFGRTVVFCGFVLLVVLFMFVVYLVCWACWFAC